MNFALSLAGNKLNGVSTPWTGDQGARGQTPAALSLSASAADVAAEAAPTPEVEELRLESMLVPGGVSETTRGAVLEQFAAQQGQNSASDGAGATGQAPAKPSLTRQNQDQLLAGLLLGSPEFQRR
jgi:hypothetical protein